MKRLNLFLSIICVVSCLTACQVQEINNKATENDPFANATNLLDNNTSLYTEFMDKSSRNLVLDNVTVETLAKEEKKTTANQTNKPDEEIALIPLEPATPVEEEIEENPVNPNPSNENNYNIKLHKGYPIVLVHGYSGSDKFIGLIDYFYKVESTLRRQGYQVYTADMNAFGHSHDVVNPTTGAIIHQGRSSQLKTCVLRVLAETGAPKVNIIAHSQGGVTSRYMISCLKMSEKVNALYTVSTPHYGTDLLKVVAKLPKAVKYCTEKFVIDFFLGKIACGDQDPNSANAHLEMLPSYMQTKFNPNTPNMEGVKYYSIAGKMSNIFMTSCFYIPHMTFKLVMPRKYKAQGDDGIVPVYSAKWGTFLGLLEGRKIFGIRKGVDHGMEINQPLGLQSHFDAVQFYLDTAKLLEKASY